MMIKKISRWQQFLGDVGYYERRAINQAADSLDLLNNENDIQSEQIGKLFDLDRAQSAEIERMRLVIKVLTEVLIDTGAVDEKVLHYRIEAALEEAESARQEAAAAKAASNRPPGAKPTDKPMPNIRCMTCSESVPRNQTHITEFGVVCDLCYVRVRDT